MTTTGKFIGMNPVICVIQPGEVPIIALFWSVSWTFHDAVFMIIHREGKFRNVQYPSIRDLKCFCFRQRDSKIVSHG